jgi:hypothetical protein
MPLQSSYGPNRLLPINMQRRITSSQILHHSHIMPGHGLSLLVRPLTQACTFAPRAHSAPLLEALNSSHSPVSLPCPIEDGAREAQ